MMKMDNTIDKQLFYGPKNKYKFGLSIGNQGIKTIQRAWRPFFGRESMLNQQMKPMTTCTSEIALLDMKSWQIQVGWCRQMRQIKHCIQMLQAPFLLSTHREMSLYQI